MRQIVREMESNMFDIDLALLSESIGSSYQIFKHSKKVS